MPFSDLETDRISIVKADGQRFDGLKASVQGSKIFMTGSKPLVEPGDMIVCARSNGSEESYRVLDPGFHEDFHGIPAGYQMSVQKLGVLPKPGAPGNTTYNFHGANSRVNVQSVDNSTNVAGIDPTLQAALQHLVSAIERAGLTADGRRDALEIVEGVTAQCESPKPSRAIVGALLKGLPAVAEIAKAGEAVLGFIGAAQSQF
ncbi:hypothetical protein [Cupriavidus basilensis]|uniref:hypothetical protein n=1 Tax=Cupriavidus basilensis TaxID=68895 RepID=UPI0007516A9E|nr:hypothetical protein [Cupriavidus basilensis]